MEDQELRLIVAVIEAETVALALQSQLAACPGYLAPAQSLSKIKDGTVLSMGREKLSLKVCLVYSFKTEGILLDNDCVQAEI